MKDTAVDRERAAWSRRRVRLMSAGFLITYGLLFWLTDPALFGSRAREAWLHLPQAGVLSLHWLWLYRPRPRWMVEWSTVAAWSLCLSYSSLWLVFIDRQVAPECAIGLLVTVMFAVPVARLSWRATAALLLCAGVAVFVAAFYRYHGAPPLLVIKDALLLVPGVALGIDAASRERLERAEFDARTRLQQANLSQKREEEARTRLFVNLSHDFRTPLTLIRGEAERLHALPRPADEAAALSRIEANASALADLVDQLLELARLDAGRSPRAPIDFAIVAIATEVVAQLRPPTGAITLTVSDAEPPAVVRADRAHVRRILFNLVANGVRQLRAAGGQLRVQVARRDGGQAGGQVGGQVIVDVIDDGPGISPERRGSIFERFTSFDAHGSTASGIGLPLARELAELNGGALELLGDAPKTTFRLSLPAGTAIDHPAGAGESAGPVAPPPGVALGPDAGAGPGGSPPGPGPGPGARPHLLVIEDHPEMRELLRRVLGERFDVTAVATVAAALLALDERPPRVVVSDVLLGERTGYEFLLEMRRRPALDGVPVLLISALADVDQRIFGLTAGADDYLSKPFSAEELRARVATAVDRADARQAALRAQRDALLMELHDGVNAALARASILLASRRAEGEDESLQGAQAAVREALEESTALLSVLEAMDQPWDELAAELRRHLAEMCERHGLHFHFAAETDGSCPRVRPTTGHTLRRIAHEALTNVIRHARARRASCTLRAAGGAVTLLVEDDGAGFAPGGARGRGMGIITRRAEQLGGQASFGGRPQGGAVVEARVPG